MFSEIMRYILDLGPTVMLPIVIIIFSKLLGMKLGDCFKSGLHIGIGFVGIGLVIGLMLDSIGPAAKAMAEHFQINLHVIDIGWPGSSPMTGIANRPVAIPVAIAVNIVMLVTRMTRVVNVDIWNIWHMTFTGAMLHIATGSYWIGILGVVVHAAFVYVGRLVCQRYPRFLRPRGYCDPARQFGVFRASCRPRGYHHRQDPRS